MPIRTFAVRTIPAVLLVLLGLLAGSQWRGLAEGIARAPTLSQREADAASVQLLTSARDAAAPVQAATDPMILSYAAKFVCLEPLQPGQFYYGAVAPLVKEATEVLIHNPNAFPITVYKKAVRAPLEDTPEVPPGAWKRLDIKPDYAWRVDCDDIARLLTGNPAATFIGTYGIGVKVEGFVVIGMGPQAFAGRVQAAALDVTAEYIRGSEVLKKDIDYHPWWIWWWWSLPWRLGYAYERILPVNDPTANIDCRGVLYDALHQDVARNISNPTEANLTHQALENGRLLDPAHQPQSGEDPYALVALMGSCQKLITPASTYVMVVDYLLVSNKTSSDIDPRTGLAPGIVRYPWNPGRLYDLTVVVPQNVYKDIDGYLRQWHTQRWIDAGGNAIAIRQHMVYFFPYWCGWGYWWGWWHGGDCTDIGVGEGESLDVEQITPTRVFMPVWPPAP